MKIDRKEALRYMGYKGQDMDGGLEKLLDACIDEVMNISRQGFTYEVFDIDRRGETICLKGSILTLEGKAIEAHLAKSEKCAVMAVTLGLEVDKRITLYSRTDLTRSIVLDACATAAVEALCDDVQERIRAEAVDLQLELTSRYSPGYGDFSVEVQREIVRVLKTYEKIGLSANENSILLPRKSVTAVIGMQKEKCGVKNHDCGNCKDIYCRYREDGEDNEQMV